MNEADPQQIAEAVRKLKACGVSVKELRRLVRKKVKPSRPPRQRWSWALDPRQRHGDCRSLSEEEIRTLGYEPAKR